MSFFIPATTASPHANVVQIQKFPYGPFHLLDMPSISNHLRMVPTCYLLPSSFLPQPSLLSFHPPPAAAACASPAPTRPWVTTLMRWSPWPRRHALAATAVWVQAHLQQATDEPISDRPPQPLRRPPVLGPRPCRIAQPEICYLVLASGLGECSAAPRTSPCPTSPPPPCLYLALASCHRSSASGGAGPWPLGSQR